MRTTFINKEIRNVGKNRRATFLQLTENVSLDHQPELLWVLLLQRQMHIWVFGCAKTTAMWGKKSDLVRWLILHQLLEKWASACVAYTKGTVQTQMLEPYSERWLCCIVGGNYFASMIWVKWSLQVNLDQSPLSYDETFLSWWERFLLVGPRPHPWWWKSYAVAFIVIKFLRPVSDSGLVLHSVLQHHHYEHTSWGNIF